MARTLAFVGCLNRETPYFQGARGKGIAVFAFDDETGRLDLLSETTGVDNPSYLTLDAEARHLYAVSEVFGWNEGTVTAYRIDREAGTLAAGTLSYVNKQPTLGSISAHASLDRAGRRLLVANYSAEDPDEQPRQSVVVFPLRGDGGLSPPSGAVKHQGSGPTSRQRGPHPHCVQTSPDDRFVLVADLGIDRISAYAYDAETGELTPQAETMLPPGSGPRHFTFSPDGRFVYLLNELASVVTSFAFDARTGALEQRQSLSALPAGFTGESHCSDIQITPDGRFLYGANRGHDSIAMFAVDPATGAVEARGHVPCGGPTPRNLGLDPSGRFLLSANQNGDRVSVFRIDQSSGALDDTGLGPAIGTPMVVKLARV